MKSQKQQDIDGICCGGQEPTCQEGVESITAECRACGEINFNLTLPKDPSNHVRLFGENRRYIDNGNGTHTIEVTYNCCNAVCLEGTEECNRWSTECRKCGHSANFTKMDYTNNGNGTHTAKNVYVCCGIEVNPQNTDNTVECNFTEIGYIDNGNGTHTITTVCVCGAELSSGNERVRNCNEDFGGECQLCGHNARETEEEYTDNGNGTHTIKETYECCGKVVREITEDCEISGWRNRCITCRA